MESVIICMFSEYKIQILGTLSSGNVDGDGDTKTCEKLETTVFVLSSSLIIYYFASCLSG